MKYRRQKLRQLLILATIVSLIYNGFVSKSSYPDDEQSDRIFLTKDPSSRHEPSSVQATSSKKRQIWLGIPSSVEMKRAILGTYLSNSSSHAFQSVCPLWEKNFMNCNVLYKFWDHETSIFAWWNHVQQRGKQSGNNPLVLWVTDRTILYPNYFNFDNFLDEKKALLFGETPTADCKSINHRPDRMACQKLSGSVTLISYELLNMTTLCWSNKTSLTLSSLRDILSPCLHDDAPPSIVSIPRQFQRAKEPLRFWNKLVTWNSLPVTVDYLTAKFGRSDKFASEVQATEAVLAGDGIDPKRMHAYSRFPDYIKNDPRWSKHLAFLHNMTLKPKGAGYWFWKAPLILHHLNKAKEGDFVIYADVDLRDHCKWLGDLIQTMINTNASLALYQVEYMNRKYTKRDVYEHYCRSDPTTDTSLMYAGGWVVVQKTPGTIKLLQDWQTGMEDYAMVSDQPSILPNIPDFDYHLHDQSILSVMIKCLYTEHYNKKLSFEGAETLTDWLVHMFRI